MRVHNEVCCSEHIKVHLAYAGTLQEPWWPEHKIWVHFNGDLYKLTDVLQLEEKQQQVKKHICIFSYGGLHISVLNTFR